MTIQYFLVYLNMEEKVKKYLAIAATFYFIVFYNLIFNSDLLKSSPQFGVILIIFTLIGCFFSIKSIKKL